MTYFKKWLLCSILSYSLLGIVNSQAQTTTLLDEKFDTDKGAWQTFDNETYSAKIENGRYILETKKDLYKNFYKYLYVNPKKDFRIEMKLTLLAQGEKNYGFGLLWGSSYTKQYYFTISKTGYYIVYQFNAYTKKLEYIQKWQISEAINGLGKANILAVEKKENTLHFFINDDVVFNMPFKTFFGSNIGISLSNNTKVAIDYFTIKSTKIPISLLEKQHKNYKKESLGKKINSSIEELNPIISQDGQTLYFIRDQHPQNIGKEKLQDVWVSKIQADGSWGEAQNMGSPINNERHNGVIDVSADNNTLLMDMNESEELGDEQGIFETHRTLSGWSTPVEIKIDNYYNYHKYESQCFSVDGNILIMGIERKDTQGGTDLYVSFRKGKHSWSEPKNMGTVLNTFANDFTPFLAADNKTLYFASEGHPGYGRADIYVAKRLDATWTNWSKPKNLGNQINTAGWDAYYSLAASGEEAFLVSAGMGKSSDIFKIQVAKAAKPEPVVMLKGNVYDADTKKSIEAEIIYEDLDSRKELGLARSNPENGKYQIVLPYGKHYGLRAKAKGYIAISENIDFKIKEGQNYIEIEQDLYLAPIKIGQTIKLQNVFFEARYAKLLDNSFSELDRLVQIMQENPTLEIELAGHTDNIGNSTLLLRLSEKRVKTVRDYLIKNGISQSRIQGKGYGAKKPIASNRSPATRKLNRRVEFKILKF